MVDRRKKTAPLRADVTLVSGSGDEQAKARKRAPIAPAPTPEPPPDEGPPPLRLRDDGEIGEGGMGSVRKVFDTVLMRHVAMKIIAPEFKDESEVRERFVQEAQITAQLEHPNIVPLYDAGQTDGVGDYVILKLVRGRTLGEELVDLQKRGSGSEGDLLRLVQILLKVCDAIAFAHSRGVVHRDLKPSNVMIGEHGQVYVVDWGVAVIAEPAPSRGEEYSVRISARCNTTRALGTPGYMAPEQALGRGACADKRSDVYALGAILYEMLGGKAPPLREQPPSGRLLSADQRVPFPGSSSIWPRLPAALGHIAMKALEPNPDDRYQSVDDFKRDLDEFVAAGDWFETRTFAAGETIVEEGAPGDGAYIIVSGRCEVKKLVGGQQEVIRSLGPADVFGETAVFFPQPRTASVIAIDKVVVKIVTRKALEFELRKSPWFGAFVRALAARFSELDRRLSEGPPSVK
jgi:tRNA A-37 threonylcarbamoyl transferase component Bud32